MRSVGQHRENGDGKQEFSGDLEKPELLLPWHVQCLRKLTNMHAKAFQRHFVFDVVGKSEVILMDIDSDEEGINISHYAQAV